MTKTTKKAKEPVTIRYKTLENGSQSIYLDIYHDGKRSYKFLKLYLVPENTPQAKIQNKNTLQAANAIKSQMILDIANGVANISNTSRKAAKTTLQDWFDECIVEYKKNHKIKAGSIDNFEKVKKHLATYNQKATLKDVDKDFCIGFINYLEGKVKKSTAKSIFALFKAILNKAVKKKLLTVNPTCLLDSDEKITAQNANRDYLEIEELKVLLTSDYNMSKTDLRIAFFFSCFCGLRIGEIRKLKGKDLLTGDKQPKLRVLREKKKGGSKEETIPLNEDAMRYLPQRADVSGDELIFRLPSQPVVSVAMKKWTTPLIPNKHITFHTARHTFATMMLTLGADLYTVSKLLGHANVTTTQIYAEIVDKKKTDAVNLTNGIFD